MNTAALAPLNDLKLQVDGMTCASCAARVEKALLKVAGVESASVNLATEKATVRALPSVPVTALEAAIAPAKVSYLYFVARNNGTHAFSSTLEEHNRAVAYYQRGAR